uniref:Uncharacterized protein n=2 Tax=Phaeomonas parva TaxID=124430 RepID=A0A7S1XY21_9STRA|mmetsp:Transcript_43106/g.135153  ORF Transcript_43106/g.135153 Transcript_43106/m.135153 type:complete len:262 (+) Transcript_43106:423-1208(+)
MYGHIDGRPVAPGARGVSVPILRLADVLGNIKTSNIAPRFDDVINFDRMRHEKGSKCLMCGGKDVLIPKQNKDVCRVCDSCVWLHRPTRQHLKWCKGCKRFNSLISFKDKPEATKCSKCRERGRRGYEKRRRRLSIDAQESETEAGAAPKAGATSTSVAEASRQRKRAPQAKVKPEPLVTHAAAILLMIKSNFDENADGNGSNVVNMKRKRSLELPPARKRTWREGQFSPLAVGVGSFGTPDLDMPIAFAQALRVRPAETA